MTIEMNTETGKIQLQDQPNVAPEVTRYQAATLKAAMKLRLKGIQVNRAYTVKAMLGTTEKLTGLTLPKGTKGLEMGIRALEEALHG